MPSWSVHLAIAKRVNEKLKVNKDILYIGSLIPDVDYHSKITRKDSHYGGITKCKNCPSEFLPSLELFLVNYRNKLKDSLILGYYIHLLTDYYYNNYFFSNCLVQNKNNEVIGIKLKNKNVIKSRNVKLRKDYKHHDFDLYGKYLFNNGYVELPKYNEKIKESLKLLKDNFFNNNDILERINYLNSKFYDFNKYTLSNKFCGLRYKLFYKEELDNIFNECCDFVINSIESNINL